MSIESFGLLVAKRIGEVGVGSRFYKPTAQIDVSGCEYNVKGKPDIPARFAMRDIAAEEGSVRQLGDVCKAYNGWMDMSESE